MGNRICVRCNAQFFSKGGPRKYCDACRAADKSLSYNQAYYETHKAQTVYENRECAFCRTAFRCSSRSHKKFCSAECRVNAHTERIAEENRRRRESLSRICPQCGSIFTATRTLQQKYCSERCMSAACRDTTGRQCSENGCGRPVRARGMCSMHYHRWRRMTVGEPNPAWDERRRANYELRRARKKTNGPVEKFMNTDVFTRDGWICGICGELVDKNLVWPDPMSASLDHIIPLSRGGPHTLNNVQLAHLSCNTRKNNRIE